MRSKAVENKRAVQPERLYRRQEKIKELSIVMRLSAIGGGQRQLMRP